MQIKSTHTIQNINEINKSISQDQNIESIQGEPKAKHNIISNEGFNYPLYSRELAKPISTVESESDDFGYSEEVEKNIKLFALKNIDCYVKFVQEFIDNTYSIEYNATKSSEELAFILGQILAQIPPQYVEQSKKYMAEIVAPQLMGIINAKIITNHTMEFDAGNNGLICWHVLQQIFKKHYEFSDARNLSNKFNFIQNSNDILIKDSDFIIGKAILNLEKIKEEKYFSIFRTLIDTHQTIEEKYLKVQNYFGFNPINEDTTFMEIVREFHDIAFDVIQNMACNITHLQIVIDGLTVLKKAPKTIENTKLLLQICNNCLNCFEEEKEAFSTIKKNQIAKGKEVLLVIKDYFYIRSCLTRLQQELTQLIDKATPIKAHHDDWSTSTTRAFSQKKKKQKQGEKKSQKQQAQKKLGTTGTNQAITSKTPEVKKEEIKNAISFNKKEDAQQEVLLHTHEEKEAIMDAILSDINLENESFEDIERETNAFMEIFRQVLEKDRSRKLHLKEERQKQSSSVQNSIIINNNINTSKPEIIKLGTKHQETLNELFKEKPGHLMLLGADIESLIKILKGRIEGCGNGSKFKIFWGDSNKQAGAYEVTHGSDLKGYLTSKYASRVADAIKQGIDRGYIARETIENINLSIQ